MTGVEFVNEIVDPSCAPDVGVTVKVGPAAVVMLAPEGETPWGLFAFPSVWPLRDGRLVCDVTMGEDEKPSDADYHYLWYVSDDRGRHWTHTVVNEDEWHRQPAFMDGETLLPAFTEPVCEHDSQCKLTHGAIATRLRKLVCYMGDQRLPNVGLLCHDASRFLTREDLTAGLPRDHAARVRIPPPTLLRLHNLSHEPYVELDDGSIIFAAYGKLQLAGRLGAGGTANCPLIFRSTDNGRHWLFYSEIPYANLGAYRLNWPLITPNMPAGNWLAVCRSSGTWTTSSPLMITRSYDRGLSWTLPQAIRSCSVNPVGGLLENGIAFRMYGRPGQHVTFCSDGEGKRWGNDFTILPGLRDPDSVTGWKERSCCNSDVCVIGPDRFLVVYSDYAYSGGGGGTRKAVLVREVIAQPA